MRQFVIDELSMDQIETLKGELKNRLEQGGTENIFWLTLPEDLLNPVQYEHKGCQPYSMAIEVGESWIKFEELVRSRTNLHCSCIAYATWGQRLYLLRFVDSLMHALSKKAV